MNTDLVEDLLRKDLADLPYGQIFVLTRPSGGLTLMDLELMTLISYMADKYEKPCILHTKDVINPNLCHCFACRINSEQVLLADRHTLLEMLCAFWQLDVNEVYENQTKFAWSGSLEYRHGEHHPTKITTNPYYPNLMKDFGKGSDSIKLEYLQANYTREQCLRDIRVKLQDNFDHNFGITSDNIIAIMMEIQNNTHDYTLDIVVQKEPVFEGGKHKENIKKCDIVLVDNAGERHTVSLSVYSKALYLTFLTYKEGITIKGIPGDEYFYPRFKKIYRQLPYASGVPTPFDDLVEDSNQNTLFKQKLSEIRTAIMKITNSNKARELYGVEGYKGEAFGVKGATDKQRAFVMDTFRLK